ncbi:hypothetical protein NPIL_411841, partial [Nephila pilipes]
LVYLGHGFSSFRNGGSPIHWEAKVGRQFEFLTGDGASLVVVSRTRRFQKSPTRVLAAKYSKMAARYTGACLLLALGIYIVSLREKPMDTTDWKLKSCSLDRVLLFLNPLPPFLTFWLMKMEIEMKSHFLQNGIYSFLTEKGTNGRWRLTLNQWE